MAGSLLEQDTGEAPEIAAQQYQRLRSMLPPLVQRLERAAPSMAATIARGSSDHAADFAAYLFGLRLSLATASIPPSFASVYRRALRLENALVLAISQSGESPDLVAALESAKAGGALTLALVNETGSLLARTAEIGIPVGAGTQRAVAATKTFVLSLTAIAHLVAAWSRDSELLASLEALPAALDRCGSVDWTAAGEVLAASRDCYVVGRGPSLPVAREIALKLKEVCGVHAEALSAAELLHGPIAIASPRLPAVVLEQDDATRTTVSAAVEQLRTAGSPVVLISDRAEQNAGVIAVKIPRAGHSLLQPLLAAQAAYPFLAALARRLGRDPDRPPQLQKVTRTL
jgi:glucosamine--fructose-6-phosphate aminotransferase (isomerizing)